MNATKPTSRYTNNVVTRDNGCATHKHDPQAIAVDAELHWEPTTNTAAWNEEPIQDTSLTLEEVRKREHWSHVDNVQDMILFWREGIEAAERGEVLSMQNFLESLGHSSWDNTGDEWRYAYSEKGWGSQKPGSRDSWRIGSDSPWGKAEIPTSVHTWGTVPDSHQQEAFASRSGHGEKLMAEKKKKTRSIGDDAYALVEIVTRHQAVDPECKRRLHAFFKVSLMVPCFLCN